MVKLYKVKLYKRDGSIATKDQFLSENKRSGRTIGLYIHPDSSEIPLLVHAYYSGIDHGADKDGKPTIYEVAINGDKDDAFHRKYKGNVERYNTEAEALAQYLDVVDTIKSGGTL